MRPPKDSGKGIRWIHSSGPVGRTAGVLIGLPSSLWEQFARVAEGKLRSRRTRLLKPEPLCFIYRQLAGQDRVTKVVHNTSVFLFTVGPTVGSNLPGSPEPLREMGTDSVHPRVDTLLYYVELTCVN